MGRRLICMAVVMAAWLPAGPGLVKAEEALLRLQPLIEEALGRNAEIQAARLKFAAAQEKIPQAGALDDPMLSLGVVNLPTSLDFRAEDMTMKEIALSQKLPFFGKRGLMGEMAAKEAQVVRAGIQERTNRVSRDIKLAFFELSHAHRAEEVTRSNKRILETYGQLAQSRYALGQAGQTEVVLVQFDVARMADDLLMLEQRRQSALARLAALLNRESAPAGQPEEIPFRPTAARLADLQAWAEEANPTLQGMRKMIEAREKASDLAGREYYPDFNLKFAYGQRDNPPDANRRDMLTAMVEINLPIFFADKQDRKVAQAKAETAESLAQYQAMKHEIHYMIADMLAMAQRLERQTELYRQGLIPQASLQVGSTMSAYSVGRAEFMALLESQMSLYRAELDFHQTLTEYHKTMANLEFLVGRPLN